MKRKNGSRCFCVYVMAIEKRRHSGGGSVGRSGGDFIDDHKRMKDRSKKRMRRKRNQKKK